MKKDEAIILEQRKTFKNFMQAHNLKAFSWAKKARISEATIRNYVNGLNKSLTGLVLEKLAQSANVTVNDLIGSGQITNGSAFKKSDKKLDQNLFIETFKKAEELIKKSNLKSSTEERAKILLALFELAEFDKNTKNNQLDQSLDRLNKKKS